MILKRNIVYFLSALTLLTSCSIFKKKGVKEHEITLGENIGDYEVEVIVPNGKIFVSKETVLQILKKELKRGENESLLTDKRDLKSFLSQGKGQLEITRNKVSYFSGILSIVDELLMKGEAKVQDQSGNFVKKIVMKEMYGLYGSYTREYTFVDGKSLLIPYGKFGE